MSPQAVTAPFYMIDQAILIAYDLNPYEISLYNAVAWHINQETGLAWPSYSRLMQLGHMARATVSKCLKSLEAKGLIEIIRRCKPGSKERAVNQYRLLNPHRLPDEGGSSRSSRGSSPPDPEVVHDADAGGSLSDSDVVHAPNRNNTTFEQHEKNTINLDQREGTQRTLRPTNAASQSAPHRKSPLPKKNRKMASDQRVEWNLFCQQLADVCQLDFEANAAEIRRYARRLWRDGRGYTVENLQTFVVWWYKSDWRGQKGDVPRLKEVGTEIRKAVEAQAAQTQDRYRYIMGEFAALIDH
jgi:DNA-binding transcriptional MocR family regulator